MQSSMIVSTLALLVASVSALPQVALSFNSQVPNVARVGEAYSFEIASTTFTQDGNSNSSYALEGQPAWLSIDSESGTLYGMPGQGNDGATEFGISATDDTGSTSMQCTLVVSADSPPQVAGNISAVLAAGGNLSGPTTLALQPKDIFTIGFGQGFFDAGEVPIEAHYATLADHTPLPSWLVFDESSLGFFGEAPTLSGSPQSWTIHLIASDITGFAGTFAAFTIEVSTNDLAFTTQYEDISVTAGSTMIYKSLLGGLTLNGQSVTRGEIQRASLAGPSWLTLQNDTLYLGGTPPGDFSSQNVEVTVIDTYGDMATKTFFVHSQNVSLFTGEVGNLTAKAGVPFNYTLRDSLFSESNLNITVDLGTASSWLHYDATNMLLSGTPSSTTSSQTVSITVVASSSALANSESQEVELQIQAAPLGQPPTTSTTSSSTTSSSAVATSTAIPISVAPGTNFRKRRNITAGEAVGVAVGCVAFLALLVALVLLLCRRERHDAKNQPGRIKISRPIPGSITPIIAVSNADDDYYNDLEKGSGLPDQPPQLELPMSPSSLHAPLAARYSHSLMSSIGDGEAAIMEDPNIPVWGRQSSTAHTPHHSYNAATELARENSRAAHRRLTDLIQLSPKKHVSRILRHSWQSPVKRDSNVHASLRGTLVRPWSGSSINNALSAIRDRSSGTSQNTHGTSLLSPRISEFPDPPSPSKRHRQSYLSNRRLDNRRSIRLVSRSDSSVIDDRPLAEKRQSFIRNRASSDIMSAPLFASSRRSDNVRGDDALSPSAVGSVNGRYRQTSGVSALDIPPRNFSRILSGTNSYANSVSRQGTVLRRQLSSPSRTIAENASERSFSSASYTEANAELAAQLALPRYRRDWVLPGEASPTPPPSSATREREAARQKWARKLGRDVNGNTVSRAESPVRLTNVGQKFGRRKHESEVEQRAAAGDRLSLLVSKDSVNGALRKRAQKEAEDDVAAQTAGGAEEEEESEWEDVVSTRTSVLGSPSRHGGDSSVMSGDWDRGKAFI